MAILNILLILLTINARGIIGDEYEATWAVEIPGGEDKAKQLAEEYGVTYNGHVSDHLKNHNLYKLSAISSDDQILAYATAVMLLDQRISWMAVQDTLLRERRSVLPLDVRKKLQTGRNKRHHMDVNCVCKNITAHKDETFGEHVYEVMSRQSDASLVNMFNDPKWPCQWELYNCGQTAGPHRVDLNVVPCWENGFTGKGVVVTIVDDGLDYINPDLKKAYSSNVSADLNDNHDEDGPMPNTAVDNNDHGTKCGGEIAMQANNNYCGVGVAYDATLGGIRFLDGVVTDTSEAAALVFNANVIDIYSCSWGPQDSGKTWEGPGKLASAALEVGANEGRHGLGSVYVWAAGNGGAIGDNCGADGYTCSIYTIGIASVSDEGLSTFYTESCSCIMAVTLNGGPHYMPKKFQTYRPSHYLVTTDPYYGCVNTFSGTSSAAPLASGVLALVLQANPNLTWRDVQHLVVETSKIPNPNDSGWQINGAGFHVHHKYGFGLMDAAKMVKTAQSWQMVSKQRKCEVEFPDGVRSILTGDSSLFVGHTNACAKSENSVDKLEHVQVIMTFRSICRGDLRISLTSPCGTTSYLIEPRPEDSSSQAVVDWPFMSVHNWGEDPRGLWKITIEDMIGNAVKCERNMNEEISVYIESVKMVFWGTQEKRKTSNGCFGKEEAAQEALKESDLEEEDNEEDGEKPLEIGVRLNHEIIEEDFKGEQKDPIGPEDFKKAKPEIRDSVNKQNEQKKSKTQKSSEELRKLLEKFLAEGRRLDEEREIVSQSEDSAGNDEQST